MATDKGVENQERRLWRQWQAQTGKPRPAEPDAMALAAYAEGRLAEAAAAGIEAWLAANPDRLADIVAARSATLRPPQIVYQTVVAEACRLVQGDGVAAEADVDTGAPVPANVIPLRRMPPQWRAALVWGSIAASLVCVSLAGFSMGSTVSSDTLSPVQNADYISTDSLDAPASLATYFADDSGT